MSKIYLSRSISRSMSADHPVGDPTGGAAYGEKNDPVSACSVCCGDGRHLCYRRYFCRDDGHGKVSLLLARR
jgi:hypothetical protein